MFEVKCKIRMDHSNLVFAGDHWPLPWYQNWSGSEWMSRFGGNKQLQLKKNHNETMTKTTKRKSMYGKRQCDDIILITNQWSTEINFDAINEKKHWHWFVFVSNCYRANVTLYFQRKNLKKIGTQASKHVIKSSLSLIFMTIIIRMPTAMMLHCWLVTICTFVRIVSYTVFEVMQMTMNTSH